VNVDEVVVDEKVLKLETAFGGGGSNTSLLEIRPKDIVELNGALVGDIT